MASNFYSRIAPDYGDLDDKSGGCPGYLVDVRENDGGVGVSLSAGPPAWKDSRGVFLTPAEGEQLVDALRQAIKRSRSKSTGLRGHPSRVRDL